ncbi:MAG: DNA polymerase III subunit beta [Candidatus Muiribacteriaceae bacterium]
MRFRIQKNAFYEVLTYLKNVIPANSALPMMSNFYLKAIDNRIVFIGTDQENTLKAELEAEVTEKGELVLPYRFVFDTLSNIPGDSMLDFELKDDYMNLSADGNIFRFVYASAEEYPEPPEYDERLSFTVDTGLLSDMIKKTIFAVSTDKTNRIHLSGLNFKVIQNILHIAGTDSRRLAYVKKPIECSHEFSFTVPFETLREVRALCSDYDKVKILLTGKENQIIFVFNNVIFFSRLLEDDFPDYLNIIPEGSTTRLMIETVKFKQILRMAKPIADAASVRSVRLVVSDGNLGVYADAEERGQFSTEVSVKTEGDNADVNFNIDYLLQVSDICDSDVITLALNSNTRPTVIRENENNDFIYIVMPIRG